MELLQGFADYRLFYYSACAWAVSIKSFTSVVFPLPCAPVLPIGPLYDTTLMGGIGVVGFVALRGCFAVLALGVLVRFLIPQRQWNFPSYYDLAQGHLQVLVWSDVLRAILFALV